MKQAVKKVFLPGLALLLTVCLVFLGTGAAIANTMPSWRDSVGNVSHIEKMGVDTKRIL